MAERIVQTAGRDALGEFAPAFARYNDDVLFGENWNDPGLDVKTRNLVTVVALMAQGITDSSLAYHIANAKAHGVSREEMVAAVTHVAFYAGWPKAWAAFNLAKGVYADGGAADADVPAKGVYAGDGVDDADVPAKGVYAGDGVDDANVPAKGVYVDGGAADADAPAQGQSDKDRYEETIPFPVGEPNPFGQFFVGQSYLAPLSTEQVPLFNVTFEPGCRNNWHVHCAEAGGGQMLVCVGGRGFYQEWGEDPVEMTPGSVVNIPAGVKHWHGAAPDSWFSHLAIEVPGQGAGTEWLEPVSDEDYGKLA